MDKISHELNRHYVVHFAYTLQNTTNPTYSLLCASINNNRKKNGCFQSQNSLRQNWKLWLSFPLRPLFARETIHKFTLSAHHLDLMYHPFLQLHCIHGPTLITSDFSLCTRAFLQLTLIYPIVALVNGMLLRHHTITHTFYVNFVASNRLMYSFDWDYN